MAWPTSNHESPDVDLALPTVTAPHYLWSFLGADGGAFRADNYGVVRTNIARALGLFGQGGAGGQRPSADVSDQRLRTWKKAFEDMGLLTVVDDTVRATRFGRAVMDGWLRVDQALRGANERIALLGAEVANRILLAPPGRPIAGVPADADIHPIRAIWRAFRALGDELHWQDVNRVLGHVHHESELPDAIERIRAFRKTHGRTYNPSTLPDLGSDFLSDDPRHITPWLNRASIGGLLFPSDADAAGFRKLSTGASQVLDDLLARPVPTLPAGATEQDYLRYLMEPVQDAIAPVAVEDEGLVTDVVEAARAFGASKFIVLSGLPGVGKTRLARLVADRLVDGDPSRLKEIQFHEGVGYEDFVEGFVPRPDGSGFERRSKVLRVLNERAIANPSQTHVLVIEEFTRANAHAVLGELLTYVEHRERPFQWSLSQDPAHIAKNLVFIVTMNPRDRSALQLDSAVKRRMHVLPIVSSAAALKMLTAELPSQDRDALVSWFEKYRSIIPFGHGLFEGASTPSAVRKIWEGTVKPLLCDATGSVDPAFAIVVDEFPFK